MKRNFNIDYQHLFEATLIPDDFSDEMKKSLITNIADLVRPNIPPKLFRFRGCKDYNIEDFKNDRITIVNPTLFSDKYDSLVYINIQAMIKLLKKAMAPSSLSSFIQYIQQQHKVPPLCKLIYNEGFCNELVKNALNTDEPLMNDLINSITTLNTSPLINNILNITMQFTTDIIRSNGITKIACFTEDVCSPIMWDRYADGYKGFALEYNFSNYVTSKCVNCSKKCDNLIIPNLLPVVYSNKRYDATEIANYYYTVELSSRTNSTNKTTFPDILFWSKAFLYKDKKTYGHEKEWRFLVYCNKRDEEKIQISGCKPTGVYYGPDISNKNKTKLHKIAVEKGIDQYDLSIDDRTSSYNLKYTKCLT